MKLPVAELNNYGYVYKNNILAFQKGPFSQWWGAFPNQQDSHFFSNGIVFNTAEKWMMAAKATLFEDKETLSKILVEKHPKVCKELGRKVANYNQELWDQEKMRVVVMGNLLKFSQDTELGRLLLDTEDSIIVEAAPWDKIWGNGLAPTDERCFDKEQWQGQNLLGEALMTVRSLLKTVVELKKYKQKVQVDLDELLTEKDETKNND